MEQEGSAGPGTPRRPRWLFWLTVLAAVATVVFAFKGLWTEESFRTGFREDWVAALSEHLFRSVALLSLDAPDPAPANAWFTAAQLAAVVFVGTASLTVVFIFSVRARAWAIGVQSRLFPGRAHTVVFGLGAPAERLVRDVRSGASSGRPRSVIVVHEEAGHSGSEHVQRLGAVMLEEDGRNPGIRRRARVDVAGEVFVATGDEVRNLDIAAGIRDDLDRPRPSERSWRPRWKIGGRAGRLRCHVHVGDPDFSETLRTQGLLGGRASAVDFRVFNVRENAARQLLLDGGFGLARRYAPAAEEAAHYVVCGFGPTGRTVALEMARLAHFEGGRRLRLTVIDDFGGDPASSPVPRAFLDRHPGFGPDLDFRIDARLRHHPESLDAWSWKGARPAASRWRFRDPDVVEYAVNAEFLDLGTGLSAPASVERLLERVVPPAGPAVRPGIVVAFEDERRSFLSAVRLRESLRRALPDGTPAAPLPIYVHLPTDAGLTGLLESEGRAETCLPLHAFGTVGSVAGYRRVVRPEFRTMAACFHRAYSDLGSPAQLPEMIGARLEIDQRPVRSPPAEADEAFSDLRPDFRYSNEQAAAHVDIKLDAVGYRRVASGPGDHSPVGLNEREQELLARMEHNRWMAERLVAGWRHGPRDDRRKFRPAFRPWDRLTDAAERAKDLQQIRTLVRAVNLAGQVLKPVSDRRRPSDVTRPSRPRHVSRPSPVG